MKKLSTLSFLAIFVVSLSAQTTFNKRVDLGFPSVIFSGVEPTDSAYYLIGHAINSDMSALVGIFSRFDLDGNEVYLNEVQVPDAWLSVREPALTLSTDGNILMVGTVQDSVRRILLAKFAPDGEELFSKVFVHPSYPDEDFLYAFDIAQDGEGDIYILGNMDDAGGGPDTDNILIKTDSGGNHVWAKDYGSGFNDFGVCLVPDGSGGFYLGGIHQNTNLVVEGYTFQAQIFHVDGEGELLGEYRTPEDYLSDWAQDMVLLEDGSLVVASGIGTEIDRPSVNTVDFEKSLFKLNPDGEKEWEVTFPAPDPSSTAHTENIVRMSDGSGFVVSGAEAEDLPGMGTATIRGWLAKVSNNGNKIWERRYTVLQTLNNQHQFYDMEETADGGLILCGEARDHSGQDSVTQAAWLLKLDQYGCLVPGCQIFDSTEEEEARELELSIYPNPTTDYLNFQLWGADLKGFGNQSGLFRITDAQGRTVWEFAAGGREETYIVPVWEWGSGAYFIQYLAAGQIIVSEKFIVQK